MDLFCVEGERTARAVQGFREWRRDADHSHERFSQPERAGLVDGKWIAFTSQYSSGFNICVVPARGGTATLLVSGEDPSWSPNSRTLIFVRRSNGRNTLSLLDVPTKQVKDVPRVSGNTSNSQPSWAR